MANFRASFCWVQTLKFGGVCWVSKLYSTYVENHYKVYYLVRHVYLSHRLLFPGWIGYGGNVCQKPLRKDTFTHRRFFGSVWLHNHLITWTCLSLARADLKYYTYLHKYIQSYKQTVFYNNFIFSQPNLPF